MKYISDFAKGQEQQTGDNKVWGVWYSNRSTSVAVSAKSRSEAISKANAKKKKGYGSVVAARPYNATDAAKARRGDWVTTRHSSAVQKSRYRPQLAAKQKGNKPSY